MVCVCVCARLVGWMDGWGVGCFKGLLHYWWIDGRVYRVGRFVRACAATLCCGGRREVAGRSVYREALVNWGGLLEVDVARWMRCGECDVVVGS